jgi:hypothetical protein
MAGSRTLKLSILADVDDLKKKLGDGQQEVEGCGGKLGEFGKKAAAAFAVAGAAAAAYAGKLLVDGVKAAIEDEKAQAKLATTLTNVTGATDKQIASVEKQITQLSLATGVADDELRPSFERLVRATNDVTEAQDLQKLALDVAAGSGKSLQTVSDALAKAYDGNTSALARLGIGMSAAELKTMSFDEVTTTLSDTFKDQASVQAETFEGKMARLQVAFDEAKESVGARLLPILTNLFDYFTKNIGPVIESVKEKFAPLTKAIDDNKEEFKALWNFVKDNLAPFMTGALKLAFSGLVTGVTAVVTAVGKLIGFFQTVYEKYKQFVDYVKNNPFSRFLSRINPFSNTSFGGAEEGAFGDNIRTAFSGMNNPMGIQTTSPFLGYFTDEQLRRLGLTEAQRKALAEVGAVTTVTDEGYTAAQIESLAPTQQESINRYLELRAKGQLGQVLGAPTVIVNVNAPSAIDSEGFTRAVIDALNGSQARTGALGTLNI